MPGGAVTAYPTATSGSRDSWGSGIWRSRHASSVIWSCRWRGGSTRDALRADLPEFVAWALIYQAEAGDHANLPLARTLAASIVNPALQARAAALEDPCT